MNAPLNFRETVLKTNSVEAKCDNGIDRPSDLDEEVRADLVGGVQPYQTGHIPEGH